MSQIIKNLAAGPVPPAVPTSFTTDYNSTFTPTGTSIPQANVENIVGSSNSIQNDNGIATQANPDSGKNLLVLLTNRLTGSQSSVNGATINLITFALGAAAAVYRFNFNVTGRDIGSGDGVGYELLGSAKTSGAAATVIASPLIDNDEDASLLAASVGFVASGNNIILQVTGVAGRTIAYKAVGTYVVV